MLPGVSKMQYTHNGTGGAAAAQAFLLYAPGQALREGARLRSKRWGSRRASYPCVRLLRTDKWQSPSQSMMTVTDFAVCNTKNLCFSEFLFCLDTACHRADQRQLLLGGTRNFFQHLLGVLCVKPGKGSLQLRPVLFCLGQSQENFDASPSFILSMGWYSLCGGSCTQSPLQGYSLSIRTPKRVYDALFTI